MPNANVENDNTDYFEYGNVRIIIKEHFSDTGKPFDVIIEESILRQARSGNHVAILQTNNSGE